MQLHKRQTIEQVRQTLDWYEQKLMNRHEVQTKLAIKRRRFFILLKAYRNGKLNTLTVAKTNAHRKISATTETAIRQELAKEQQLIKNPAIALDHYNYQAVRDAVVEQTGTLVSAQTVRNRAKALGYYLPRTLAKTKHVRVVLTTATGLLLQHDASHHLWSPYAKDKWVLITTIDDYSRLLLYADFWAEETAWAHIMALKSVVLKYGVGSEYYTDNHAIFRFTERMETYWQTPKVDAKTIKTQWQQAVKACGMDNIWALSPEAKGKIERPYRWLQDRVVRSCAKAEVITIEQGRDILKHELDRYNTKQVHSTTGEIPLLRFQRAERAGNTVFKPLVLPKPYTSTKDIFCLREERIVNGYNQVSWNKRYLKVPNYIPEGAKVQLHIVPDDSHPEIRVWYKEELVTAILLTPTQLSIQPAIPDLTDPARPKTTE